MPVPTILEEMMSPSTLTSPGHAHDERGQGLAEYALILSLIAIIAIVALIFLGGEIAAILSSIGVQV